MEWFGNFAQGIVSGLLSILTGGLYNYSGNLGRLLNAGGDSLNNADPAGSLDNYMAKQTGSRLTDAEREANEWTASREDLAYERSKMAYQNQVADMQAAGLNPAMMYGGGAGGGTAVPAPSSSVAPAGGSGINLGSLLQLAIESKMLPAKIANLNADTAEKIANADSTETQTGYFKAVANIRAEAERLENEMKGSQIRAIETSIKHEKVKIENTIQNTRESESRQELILQQAILANVQAGNIKYMQPFLAAESSSRAGLNKAQARVAAVDEAYRQGLIDEGAIAAAVRLDNASASEKEVSAAVQSFKQSVADGSLADSKSGSERLVMSLYTGLDNLSKSILGKW